MMSPPVAWFYYALTDVGTEYDRPDLRNCRTMNFNRVLFFAASDARYFGFCVDLIESLRHARGELPRMCVLDVGLHPHQSTELKKHVETVIEPGWDLGHREHYPSWFRAMTARPFLPNYASEAEIIVWIDADAWVQSWGPLNDLICAATSGDLAIVEERFGDGFVMTVKTPVGPKRIQIDSGAIKADARGVSALI
jgi:hypothetical protein